MTATRGSNGAEPAPHGDAGERGVDERMLGTSSHIESLKPDWLEKSLQIVEGLLPRFAGPDAAILTSFKNKILVGALVVLIGAVVVIGITLQVAVFPKIDGDRAVITQLKVIHFFASLAIIGISWLFIGWLSKKITHPLRELTRRADQISREAGIRICEGLPDQSACERRMDDRHAEHRRGDEIFRLTSSFNRMLVHLKASETRLRESEEKYRFLLDNGPSPIFVVDADTMMILDVNARAEEEYQYTREELLSMSFADLGLDREREQTSHRLKQLYPTEVALLPVLQHTRKDGSLFMVSFQARLTRYRDRPAIIAAVWDVTEGLERHARLIQAGKMATLGEMATGIAHELNQPLNVIRLGCDYLTKRVRHHGMVSPEELGKITGEITSSVERASRIITHLRQFGRKAEETMSPVDVNAPITNVFTLLGRQLEARGIYWNVDLDTNLPLIMGDVNRLEQVFINLVINARDAILAREIALGSTDRFEKTVAIRSYREGDRVVVTISDTGPGIPAQIRTRVFEPFFTTKKTGDGTGLGLSISYGIVKEHNGTIEIDSRQTAGATFRMTFPVLANGDQG